MARGCFALRGATGMALLALAGAAVADVKAGEEAWNRGDYTAAVQQWEAPAGQGDPDAQFHLAQAYRLGRGVPRDLAKAEMLFGKASAQGHVEAGDFYGLMMFDRGERTAAMPYIRAAAGRGDPRAQYLLGIAHFNGDLEPKDWVRAYALMTLAQSAGLPQAAPAMAQMDQHIPLAQRQAAATLAARLGEEAETNRRNQLAAVDLGSAVAVPTPSVAAAPAPVTPARVTPTAPAPRPVAPPPSAVAAAAVPAPASPPVPIRQAAARPAPAPAPVPATASTATKSPASGPWRVQLGAFGVAANADALWARIKSRPELAGHPRANVRAGAVTKLQATGYASREAANRACTGLTAAGLTCLPVQD
ncbi:MAG: SPOR domain-containing protein [Sphingomonadales bacterium]|nr:SPOR domain-containing protein [Sphingomonadales bacterium]